MKTTLSLLFCLLLLHSSPIFSAPLEKVSLQLKWLHQFQFAGYYAAKELGFYAAEGLDVTIFERSPDKDVVEQVVSGEMDFAVGDSGILSYYARGAPIVALAAIFQHNPLVFISKQSSAIISPYEMKGKRIMFDLVGAGDSPLRAVLLEADLTEKNYTAVKQSFNNEDLTKDKIDVMSAYLSTEIFYFQQKKIKINIINPQNYGIDFYGDMLFTSQHELLHHQGRAEKFRRASLKGWQYALDHPEELIQLIHKKYHSRLNLAHLRFEAEAMRKLILPDVIPLGQIDAGRMRKVAEVYAQLKLSKPLSENDLARFIHPLSNHHNALQKTKLLRFGVLSYRPKEITMAQWLPLVQELEQNLPDYRIELIALTFPELDKATKAQQLDFILTNPESYILLKNKIGLNAVATLITLEKGHPLTQFAGVIFTRADRTDIKTLADLNGKRIASPAEESLGGYLMQRWELEKNNIIAKEYIFTGMPHDNVVNEVLEGKADAGFVRSGVLEKVAVAGKFSLGEKPTLRILTNHTNETNGEIIPVLHSTEHYPEWVFGVTLNISTDLARRVSLILLNIKSDSKVAKAADIAGFSSPADYTSVEVLMLRLRTHPNELKYFNFSDVFWRYREFFIISVIMLTLILMLVGFLMRTNRHAKHTEKKLVQSERHLRAIIEETTGCVKLVARDGTLLSMNRSGLNTIQADSEDIVRNHCVYSLIAPEYRTVYQAFNETVCDGKSGSMEFEIIDLKGTRHWMVTHAVPFNLENSDCVQLAFTQEITERKQIEERLRILSVAVEQSPTSIVISDLNGDLLYVNPRFTQVTGYSVEEAIGKNPRILKSGLTSDEVYKQLWDNLTHGKVWQGELINRRKNGETYWEEVHLAPVKNPAGNTTHYVGVKVDISERKAAEEEIKQLAFYDPLTGLPNRRKLVDRLAYSITLNKRANTQFVVFMMDLDKFKAVNDKLGHAAGDELLKQVAKRLTNCLRESDMVARLGGDEFVLVLENLKVPDAAETIALKVIADLTVPFQLFEHDCVQIGASIGISIYPQHGNTPEILMDHADTALYHVKENGRGYFAHFSEQWSLL